MSATSTKIPEETRNIEILIRYGYDDHLYPIGDGSFYFILLCCFCLRSVVISESNRFVMEDDMDQVCTLPSGMTYWALHYSVRVGGMTLGQIELAIVAVICWSCAYRGV